jgi:hypothetical protein
MVALPQETSYGYMGMRGKEEKPYKKGFKILSDMRRGRCENPNISKGVY